jgi:CO/xanthine dehydrogenase Mo-binding subunit
MAVYVEKTGLGPFETTQVEARPTAAGGRHGRLVDGPGLETVLAQILGEALGLPAGSSTYATPIPPPSRAASGPTAHAAP